MTKRTKIIRKKDIINEILKIVPILILDLANIIVEYIPLRSILYTINNKYYEYFPEFGISIYLKLNEKNEKDQYFYVTYNGDLLQINDKQTLIINRTNVIPNKFLIKPESTIPKFVVSNNFVIHIYPFNKVKYIIGNESGYLNLLTFNIRDIQYCVTANRLYLICSYYDSNEGFSIKLLAYRTDKGVDEIKKPIVHIDLTDDLFSADVISMTASETKLWCVTRMEEVDIGDVYKIHELDILLHEFRVRYKTNIPIGYIHVFDNKLYLEYNHCIYVCENGIIQIAIDQKNRNSSIKLIPGTRITSLF